ncbi:hypothetical protein GCM10011579_032030 [Streptomyces albiflavescens]|uniref:Saccharopine dehydrogenase n=1 Tax=Streptomyces albiflavescens TaxID=1623582 RepID=A0A917Y2H0_9ACTN|nr:hypothetical protein [Streptomyces albiflavescens]GGN63528.1 hypothetical protein GCM10011579_032030 [Streptomyces albiflavescens]
MRDGLALPSARWKQHRLVEERTAAHIRPFTVQDRQKNAFLVSGTEVLFLPEAFPRLEGVTVYNGWFPALSRPATVLSALAGAAAHHPGGRRLIDTLTRPFIGPPGGPDTAERARSRTYVVAAASGAPGGSPLAEVRLEGPSIYNLTGELMAFAADQLATGAGFTPGVVSPADAFGLDTLRQGCARIGLTPV